MSEKTIFGEINRVELAKKLATRLGNEVQGLLEPIPTPWNYINRLMPGGFVPGESTSIAGAIGGGKTYMAVEICHKAESMAVPWVYLPLEIRADEILQRFIALHHNRWSYMAKGKDKVAGITNEVFDNPDLVKQFAEHIAENPRKAIRKSDGNLYVPEIPWQSVIDWLKWAVQEYRLIVIDPISLIDYSDNGKDFVGQREFIKMAVAITENSNCHTILVCHLSKRGSGKGKFMVLDDVEGSTAIVRHVYNVLLVDKHSEIESTVRVYGGYESEETHKRTVFLGKVRNGIGELRLAFDFSQEGPKSIEHGIIKQ